MAKLSTEERILKAAIVEFSQYGLDGARVDRIAKKSRLNKAMIYYHFKSKNALYEKVISFAAGKLYGFIKEAINQGKKNSDDPLEQLIFLFRQYIQYIMALDINLVKIMMREVITDAHYFKKITLPNFLIPIRKHIEEIFESAKKAGRIREINSIHTIVQIVGSVMFYNVMRISLWETEFAQPLFKENSAREYADNLFSMIQNGIVKNVKQ